MSRMVPKQPMPSDEATDDAQPQATPEKAGDVVDPTEDELDSLLQQVEQKKSLKARTPDVQPESADIFRQQMRQTFVPLFQEMQAKYAAKGVELEMDADELLGGGSTLKFRFRYESLSVELDGTLLRGGVAFYLIRSTGNTQGAVVSGPMLRIRNLGADDFRQFVVQHIRSLIRDALRRA